MTTFVNEFIIMVWCKIKVGLCLTLRNRGVVWNKLPLNYSHHFQDHLFIYFQKRKTERSISALENFDYWPENLPGWAWRAGSQPVYWSAGEVQSVFLSSWPGAYPAGHSVLRTFVLLHPAPSTLNCRHPTPLLVPRCSSKWENIRLQKMSFSRVIKMGRMTFHFILFYSLIFQRMTFYMLP